MTRKKRLTVTVDAELVRAGQEAVAAYEREAGAISDEELAAQRRADRESATVVRGPSRKPAGGRSR